MGCSKKSAVALCLLLLLAAVPNAQAHWSDDGVAVCTATGDQGNTQLISDGGGGAIIVWDDLRGADHDIYAQRVDAIGRPQWSADGVPVCTAAGDQLKSQLISDGSGGVIITWHDERGGNFDIYAQRINAGGTVRWAANGIAVCTASGDQINAQLIADGAGGAIITWDDQRSGNYDIYAQRVSEWGTKQWTASGVVISAASDNQHDSRLISDGASGAIIVWNDRRGGYYYDIYAQRVDAAGTVQWTADGEAICYASYDQASPELSADGAGGAIFAWYDQRSGTGYDIYAQRVNAGGAAQWNVNGEPVCTAAGWQLSPQITSDGGGGAIITWNDARSGLTDIYAQRIDAAGTAQWNTGGVAISTAYDDQSFPRIIAAGTGGAIITWDDERGGYKDIYAQRVDAGGTVQWTTDGVAVCTAAGNQEYPRLVSNGAGGAIFAWTDSRGASADIYVHMTDDAGRVGYMPADIFAVRDVPGDQGGSVYISFYASLYDCLIDPVFSHYTIWRAIAPVQAARMLESGACLLHDVRTMLMGDGGPVIIRAEESAGGTRFWELVATHDGYNLEAYAKTVPTLFDSTAACTEYHYFQVIAHGSEAGLFWISDPDSGRSVDNLAPCPPASLAGEQHYEPEGLRLSWNPNTEPDLGCYAVYRGITEDFIPGPGTMIASSADTAHFDAAWRWDSGYYYKVSAIDIHGNESPFALLRPGDVTGDEVPELPVVFSFAQNYPNPFNPSTWIRFSIGTPGAVTLRIYDAGGRLVRELVDAEMEAGRYELEWNGRDARDRMVASGCYFCKLVSGDRSEVRKMVLIK